MLWRERRGSGGESERGFTLCWELLPGSICFSFCSWHRVFSLTQPLFPLPLHPGHGFACAAHRCEAGGSFPHSPEVSAPVMMKTTAQGFTLLFILPLNSVQPPFFPCITLTSTTFQAFLEWRCPPSSSGPWRQAASRLWQTGLDPKPCFPLTTAWPPNVLQFPSSFRARLRSDVLNPQPLTPTATPPAPREALVL